LRKLFPLLFILALAGLGYYYQDKVLEQYRHAKGVYYIYKGDQAYSADNMGKTLEYYIKGLELYPQHYEAWFNLGNIYAVHEDYYAALDAYENAIKANPKFVLARMNMGIVYSEDLGFFDEAIEQFDEVAKINLFKIWIPYVYSNVKSTKINRGFALFNKGVAFRQKALYLPLEKQHLVYELLGKAIEAYSQALKFNKAFGDENQKLPIKINFYLQKNKKILLDLGVEIEQERQKIIETYGALNPESGDYTIPADNIEDYLKELQDLMDLEQEVQIYTFNINAIDENLELTTAQMEALLFMIEE
jgi:tetratricopeptide (TPR) repeat protein